MDSRKRYLIINPFRFLPYQKFRIVHIEYEKYREDEKARGDGRKKTKQKTFQEKCKYHGKNWQTYDEDKQHV
jgi:hypothetical protein